MVDYVLGFAQTRGFVERIQDFLRFTLPLYVQEGKAYLTIAVGCTGGRHRSVVLAEEMA
ncbi:MAG: RNase adaptor protein RapZ, partial [Acidobacteriia bacterium]|nr:RNase adaptor protein RapZ [Terriglobia bacterium]